MGLIDDTARIRIGLTTDDQQIGIRYQRRNPRQTLGAFWITQPGIDDPWPFRLPLPIPLPIPFPIPLPGRKGSIWDSSPIVRVVAGGGFGLGCPSSPTRNVVADGGFGVGRPSLPNHNVVAVPSSPTADVVGGGVDSSPTAKVVG